MTGPGIGEQLVAVLRRTLGPGPVALHEPVFAGHEWDYVRACLDSGWVSSAGPFVDRFERELAAYLGAPHVIAVINGTAALHIALLLAEVRPGDEVLIPSLTFIATANAVAYCGAMPHFVDCDPRTLGLDPGRLGSYLAEIAETVDGACRNRRTGARIAAVVPVHVFGHPMALDELAEVAARYKLPIIEDATEAIGSRYRGRAAGTMGLMGTLSFNGNKTITTGGGGAIITADETLARHARHLTTTAKVPHRWLYLHDEIGFNYRLPNLNAALGCAQLEELDGFIERKRRLAARYAEELAPIAGLRFFHEPAETRSNYWLQAVMLDCGNAGERDAVLAATNDAGYGTRPAWQLLHRLPMYANCPRMELAAAEDIERRLINLPSGPALAAG